MKGFLHDHCSDFGIRAAEARHSCSGDPATADPGQSPEACRQAKRTAEVSLSLFSAQKDPARCRVFLHGEQMANSLRFGKKVRVESTFQIKHRLLLWWLKHQAAKEASDAAIVADTKASVPMHVRGLLKRAPDEFF